MLRFKIYEHFHLLAKTVRFAYQCFDNYKMYKYAKFDQNIPCSVITKRPQPGQNYARRSLTNILDTSRWTKLKLMNMQTFDPNIPCGFRVMSIFTS